jgi:hypothetical protein
MSSHRVTALDRMLFRSLRGNCVTHFIDVDAAHRSFDPTTGAVLLQTVVVVCFSGQQIRQRIERVCDSMDVHVYPLPDTESLLDELFRKLEFEYHHLSSVLDHTYDMRCRELRHVALRLEEWVCVVCPRA